VSLPAFVLVDAILFIGNHTISEYLRLGSISRNRDGTEGWVGVLRPSDAVRLL
jgi:hypothetical protein